MARKRWIFQDVHSGGAASIAGIEPGDILLNVDGRKIVPPEHPVFPMGKQTSPNGEAASANITKRIEELGDWRGEAANRKQCGGREGQRLA
jgi:predicted metalloprotease with PDZ domain